MTTARLFLTPTSEFVCGTGGQQEHFGAQEVRHSWSDDFGWAQVNVVITRHSHHRMLQPTQGGRSYTGLHVQPSHRAFMTQTHLSVTQTLEKRRSEFFLGIFWKFCLVTPVRSERQRLKPHCWVQSECNDVRVLSETLIWRLETHVHHKTQWRSSWCRGDNVFQTAFEFALQKMGTISVPITLIWGASRALPWSRTSPGNCAVTLVLHTNTSIAEDPALLGLDSTWPLIMEVRDGSAYFLDRFDKIKDYNWGTCCFYTVTIKGAAHVACGNSRRQK